MKTLALLFSMFLTEFLSHGQSGVTTNAPLIDSELRKRILGTWGAEGRCLHGRFTFAPDGTKISTNWVAGTNCNVKIVSRAEATWLIQDGFLISKTTKTTDPELAPLGRVSRTKIIRLDDTELVGLTEIGTTNVVSRIKR